MRLTFIPADSMIIIDGQPAQVDLTQIDVPDGLHAIQHYPATETEPTLTEVEWTDTSRALGNSLGTSGLPGGDGYLQQLADLHASTIAAQEEITIYNETEEEEEEEDVVESINTSI